MTKLRAREAGLLFPSEVGTHNAITDVPGVEVGFCTRVEGSGSLVQANHGLRPWFTVLEANRLLKFFT